MLSWFKQDRGILNLSGKIDIPFFVDFVVRFRAGSFKTATENLNLDAYRYKPNRRLVVMSERPVIGNRTFIDSPVKKVYDALKRIDDMLGIICINGNIAGGRSALEFAAALKDKHPI